MRILWVSHLLPFPPQGGARQRAFGLLRGVAREHEVTFVGFNQADFCSPAELEDARDGLSKYCEVALVEGIPSDNRILGKQRLAIASLFKRNPYTINWLSSRAFGERLRSIVGELQPDLAHFDTISLAPYRRLAPGAVATLNHHNVESHMLLRRAERETGSLARQYYRQEALRLQRYERDVAPHFAMHLVCSSPDAARLRAVAPHARIEVIPNGVDTSYFHQSNPPPSKVRKSLIFIGGLSWYPNVSAVSFLIRRVWPLIPDLDATLTIIGRSPPDWLVRESQSDRRIVVTGWVDDVRPFMERSAVYVCPIFDGGGTRLKVLDALAMGVPLVASRIACEGIDVEDGRHVLIAGAAEEFARQINAVWDDAALAVQLATNGVDLIRTKYSFDAIGKELSTAYAGLVAG